MARDGPRGLRRGELSFEELPLGDTIRGFVRETRPYGTFVELFQEDGTASWIRGYCELDQVRYLFPPGDTDLPIGLQVAVKLLNVDSAGRLHVSALQALPMWNNAAHLPKVSRTEELLGSL